MGDALFGATNYGGGSRTTQTNVGPVPQTVPMGANMEGIYDLFRRMTRSGSSQRESASPFAANRVLGGYNSSPARPGGLRMGGTPAGERMAGGGGGAPDYADTFGTMAGLGPQSAGVAYQAWSPGMPFSPGNAPVYTGGWSRNTMNAMPGSSTIQGDINVDPLRAQLEAERVEAARQANKRGELALAGIERDPERG